MKLLQPLWWRCNECVIHHEQDMREEQQCIYVAQTSNNRVIISCEPYCCLLPQCEALRICCLGFFDRNKMVLWPGCGGCVVWSFHKNNIRSVRFIGKRRGCCCNLSGGIALNVWFTTNGICVKNNNIYTWHEQAIIEWLCHLNSIVACCHSAKLCTYAVRAFPIATKLT